MRTSRDNGIDRRRAFAAADDVQRITDLGREIHGNALELEGHSRLLRATLDAFSMANEDLERLSRESAAPQEIADAAATRLAILRSITVALSSTTTPDGIADSVLREALVALECDAAAIVVAAEPAVALSLFRESGSLDSLMRSFGDVQPGHDQSPFADAIETRRPIYLESLERAFARYPSFRKTVDAPSLGAWIFLPLEIGGRAVGALAFGFARSREFSLLDRYFADTLARYFAQALDSVSVRIAASAAFAQATDMSKVAADANHSLTPRVSTP